MRIRGFTLVELLVVLTIVAILLTIGLPSFRGAIRSNRLATTTNEVIGSISLARTEAIRTTRGSGVCATSDGGATCSGTWADGWLVWADGTTAGAGAFDSGDTVIRIVGPHREMELAVLNEAGTALSQVTFDPRGRPLQGPARFAVRPAGCEAGLELVRNIFIARVGQVVTRKEACP